MAGRGRSGPHGVPPGSGGSDHDPGRVGVSLPPHRSLGTLTKPCTTGGVKDCGKRFLPSFGHVGDGNFHVMILVDPQDPVEMKAAEDLNDRLVDRALAMDGTCTGEHGIGLRKMASLQKELPGAIDVMRAIKRELDPLHIMNPGKVFTDLSGAPDSGNPGARAAGEGATF
ncbi:MAG: hypothetical protein H0U17_09150 [Actinobacteria bacterium]|nr:hypothetical protein [Actinomycetota bacterium]